MITINSAEIILESERFRVEKLNFTLEGLQGRPKQTFHRDIIRHPGAVVVLAIDNLGKIYFVRQPRVVLNKELIELPAGTLNKGELPLNCAKRELAEEIGMAASEWIDFGEIYPAPGFCDERQFLFVAKGLSEYRLPQDDCERITVQSLTVDEVYKIISDGSLQDGKSLALLFKAKVAGVW